MLKIGCLSNIKCTDMEVLVKTNNLLNLVSRINVCLSITSLRDIYENVCILVPVYLYRLRLPLLTLFHLYIKVNIWRNCNCLITWEVIYTEAYSSAKGISCNILGVKESEPVEHPPLSLLFLWTKTHTQSIFPCFNKRFYILIVCIFIEYYSRPFILVVFKSFFNYIIVIESLSSNGLILSFYFIRESFSYIIP